VPFLDVQRRDNPAKVFRSFTPEKQSFLPVLIAEPP
jgi:hypothetical protein